MAVTISSHGSDVHLCFQVSSIHLVSAPAALSSSPFPPLPLFVSRALSFFSKTRQTSIVRHAKVLQTLGKGVHPDNRSLLEPSKIIGNTHTSSDLICQCEKGLSFRLTILMPSSLPPPHR